MNRRNWRGGEAPAWNHLNYGGQAVRALLGRWKKLAVYLCDEDGEHWAAAVAGVRKFRKGEAMKARTLGSVQNSANVTGLHT